MAKFTINSIASVVLMATAMCFIEFGCSSTKPSPDPLTDFHFSSLNNLHTNTVIMNDYQNYVQNLPPREKDFIGATDYLEDSSGQHAVRLTIGVGGTWWQHLLIYDKDDRRIKVIKYRTGGYRS